MQRCCKIFINNFEIIADLNNSITASQIWSSLPISSDIHTWGNEIYFNTSVSVKIDEKAKEIASPTKPFPITPTLVLLILNFLLNARLRQ